MSRSVKEAEEYGRAWLLVTAKYVSETVKQHKRLRKLLPTPEQFTSSEGVKMPMGKSDVFWKFYFKWGYLATIGYLVDFPLRPLLPYPPRDQSNSSRKRQEKDVYNKKASTRNRLILNLNDFPMEKPFLREMLIQSKDRLALSIDLTLPQEMIEHQVAEAVKGAKASRGIQTDGIILAIGERLPYKAQCMDNYQEIQRYARSGKTLKELVNDRYKNPENPKILPRKCDISRSLPVHKQVVEDTLEEIQQKMLSAARGLRV